MKRSLVFIFTLIAIFSAIPAFAQSDITVYATAQRFERGLMLWRSDTSSIWVLTNAGGVFNFPAVSYANLPDNPIQGGALRPINGFGRVWGNNASVRAAIGMPTMSELGFDMRIVSVGGVTYLYQLDGTIYQINPNGTWILASGTPPVSPSASISGFDVQPSVVNPGNTVLVTWSVLGIDRVRLEVHDTATDNVVNTFPALPSQGSIGVAIPASISGNARIVLIPDNPEIILPRAEIVIDVVPLPSHSVVVSAAFQQYQHGFMIWRSDTGDVYVFSGTESGSYGLFPYSYLQNLPDNALGSAPANLVRPINGFGRVWGNTEWVRSALGWATAPEQGYTTMFGLASGLPVSFTLPNGRWVNLVLPTGTWYLGS